MTEDNLTIQADNIRVHEKDTSVPEAPGEGVIGRSGGNGSPLREKGESDAAKTPPLHQKLLEIANAGQTAEAATSAEFNTLLPERKSEIDATDKAGKTALHVAIEYGLEAAAQTLIQNGANISTPDDEGQKPLYLACEKGSTKLVNLLLDMGAFINAASNDGSTPLAVACQKGHTEIVDILLNNKADTKISDEENWTPLHWASWENLEKTVNRLLNEDTSTINAIETLNNWTPLHVAAFLGHEKVVALLLERNADLYVKDRACCTPLMVAAGRQHPKTVGRILGHRSGWKEGYLDMRNSKNYTALHVASMKGYHEIASLLIVTGADCNAKGSQGMTSLHLASFHNHSKIVDLLLADTMSPAVDVNAEANDGRTSLHLASLQGNECIVKALFRKKAAVDARDKRKMTPLHLACGATAKDRCPSDPDPTAPGPSSGDDPNSERRNSEAQSGRHFPVVKFLLLNGANPGIRAINGDTALHCAATLGDKSRIDVLLNHMKEEDFSWGDWKDSPVHSALGGSNPQAAMESLLAKQEVKKAPFWNGEGRIQVITEATKDDNPYDILHSIFRELPRDDPNQLKGSESWGPFQWAAHERLADVLSALVNKSESVNNVDEMIHEALQITSGSMNNDELWSEPSCESLVQVMWILITNSERTTKNTNSVKAASNFVRENIEQMAMEMQFREDSHKILEDARGLRHELKKLSLIIENERLIDGQGTYQLDGEDTVKDFEGHVTNDTEPHTSKISKGFAMLSVLQDILKDPPFAQISQTHKDEENYSSPVPEDNHQKIVETTEATVVGFFTGKGESGRFRRNRTLKEIVYGLGPTDIMGKAIRNLIDITSRGPLSFNSKLYAKDNLKLTWIHLPSTNMIWMNDLLTKVMSHEGYRIGEYYELRSFFRDSWVQVPDKESRSRMMRPRYVARPKENRYDPKRGDSSKSSTPDREGEGQEVREKNENVTKGAQATAADSQKDRQKVYDDWEPKPHQPIRISRGHVPASATYMPYLAYSAHCQQWDNTELEEAHDRYEELQNKYKDVDKPQHGSPTLDEWYYQFAQGDNEATGDQDRRNESQVVSKYLKENPETNDLPGTNDRNQWTVVRVNQLWVWTISKDWIITATSSPLENSPDALVEDILNRLSKQSEYGGSGAQPTSADELVPVIVDHCIGSYERRSDDKNRISIGQTFSHYINSIGRQETILFERFRAWSLDEQAPKQGKGKSNGRSQIQNSTPDASRMNTADTNQRDVKPQSLIISEAIDTAKSLYCNIKDVRDELSILKSVAQFQQIVQKGRAGKDVDESRFSSTYVVKDLEELDSIAGRIQSAIGTTLSLQQNDVANRQATEATKQGKTVMTFTFATVLFLPLSFLSSLFALDVASFQEAPAWAFYVIFFVSIGVSAILGFSVFYWDIIKHPKKMLFDIVKKLSEDDSSPTSRPSKSPQTGGPGNKDREKSGAAVSITSKSKAAEPSFRRLFRRHRRGGDEEAIEDNAAE